MDNKEIIDKKRFLYYQGSLNDELYNVLMDREDPETGETLAPTGDVKKALKALKGTAAEVAAAAGSMVKELNAEIQKAKDAEAYAKAYRQNLEDKVEILKDAIADYMNSSHLEKVTGLVKLSFRSSQAVSIDNEADIPDMYWRIKKEPDKVAIKTALKAGLDVPGASIQTNRSLQIK